MHSTTDVLIVGGGPAGLAAAIALQQRGVDCTVVEARAPGIDKACGEGLMPDALASLAALGVPITPTDGHTFRGIRFINPRNRVSALFPDGVGVGVRRPHLHNLLHQRATAVGVASQWQSRVKLLDTNTATINDAPIRFKWLIGADGHSSLIRRWAGLDRIRSESLRYGFRRHYALPPWTDHVEIHWGPAGQFYVTPVGPDCVCAVYITRDARHLRAHTLADFPELAGRLLQAPTASVERGARTATRRLRRVTRGNIALIGDASGSADAITGEGLAMTFRQATSLANAIATGNLGLYEREHARIARLPHLMGQLMLAMDRWPQFQSRAIDMLAANPAHLSDLLSVHVGHRNPLEFALTRGLQLVWNLSMA